MCQRDHGRQADGKEDRGKQNGSGAQFRLRICLNGIDRRERGTGAGNVDQAAELRHRVKREKGKREDRNDRDQEVPDEHDRIDLFLPEDRRQVIFRKHHADNDEGERRDHAPDAADHCLQRGRPVQTCSQHHKQRGCRNCRRGQDRLQGEPATGKEGKLDCKE